MECTYIEPEMNRPLIYGIPKWSSEFFRLNEPWNDVKNHMCPLNDCWQTKVRKFFENWEYSLVIMRFSILPGLDLIEGLIFGLGAHAGIPDANRLP